MKTLFAILAALPLVASAQSAAKFDHSHRNWDALLKKHVVLIDGGNASRVRYAAFSKDRAVLRSYLQGISSVTETEFRRWSKTQQMAFLINAYNALTVEKVLTRYPNLKSIRDFGTVFGNPWKDRFFTLFGRDSTLDEIEHEMLRAKGVYEEPRVHYAVSCASIGCPMLREEAYVAERLDAQLEAQARRFLSDRSRNRYNPQSVKLEVSSIFDWYKEDWSSGYRGISAGAPPIFSREQYFSRYAGLFSGNPEHQRLIAERLVPIVFLDYDWGLNDAK